MRAEIIVAPFSNSDIRDWPVENFIDLIHLLIARQNGYVVHLVGSSSQFARAAEIVRTFDSVTVKNGCGQFSWIDLRKHIANATCVIANNSGIAHLGALLGVPTVCIFGGAHDRREWAPRGRYVRTVSLALPCSPCHRHAARECPFHLECLRGIAAIDIARTTFELMDAVAINVSGGHNAGAS